MRLTSKVFIDLAIWTIGFGVIIGVAFPFFMQILGIPVEYTMNWRFFSATVFAGIVSGGINYLIAKTVVKPRLDILSGSMKKVGKQLVEVSLEELQCNQIKEQSYIPVDSEDEIGETAKAFNFLLDNLMRSQQLEQLYHDFNKKLSGTLDLDALAKTALNILLEQVGGEAGCIISMNDDTSKILCQHCLTESEKLLDGPFLESCFKSSESQRLQLPEGTRIHAGIVEFDPKDIILTPLMFKQIPIGVVILASSRPFKQETERTLDLLRTSLGLAMNNARSHDNLQKIAAMDSLTGAYNRRFGMKRFTEEMHRSIRHNNPLGIIMFDLDHFKKVNDTYGHLMGDKVLKGASEVIRSSLREGDILIRWGGEEFLVLLPGATKKDVYGLAERYRHIINSIKTKDGNVEITVTVSMGASSFPEVDAENENEIIKIVDEALYAAKEQGRNRVVMA